MENNLLFLDIGRIEVWDWIQLQMPLKLIDSLILEVAAGNIPPHITFGGVYDDNDELIDNKISCHITVESIRSYSKYKKRVQEGFEFLLKDLSLRMQIPEILNIKLIFTKEII